MVLSYAKGEKAGNGFVQTLESMSVSILIYHLNYKLETVDLMECTFDIITQEISSRLVEHFC